MKVLLVDDNPDILATLALIVEHGGYEVATAATGQAALQRQYESPADILVTDILMPDVDGIEVIDIFRVRWPGVKIVAVSGGGSFVRGDYLSVAKDVGADVVMRKPVAPEELLRALKDLRAATASAREA